MVVLLHFSADRVYVRFSEVCCSVLQCGVVFRSVLQRLQCVACLPLRSLKWFYVGIGTIRQAACMYDSLQCAASVLQCVAVCCIETSGMVVFKDLRVSASCMQIRFPEEFRV